VGRCWKRRDKNDIIIKKNGEYMAQKQYLNTEVGWIDYLTNQRYLTLNEIEYRKSIVEKSGCDFDEIFNYIKE
jgi:energy-converting hydrogenase Eha subunit F